MDKAQPAGTDTPLCTSMPKVVTLDTARRFSVPLDVCVAAVKANANTWVERLAEHLAQIALTTR